MAENDVCGAQTGGGKKSYLPVLLVLLVILFVLSLLLFNKPGGEPIDEAGRAEFDSLILEKWNKSFADLPTARLVVISPHNHDIQQEFQRAFEKYYALENGQRAIIWWEDFSGASGSNVMLSFLTQADAESRLTGIDVIFGGGEYVFDQLALNGLLKPMELSEQTLENIPQSFNGIDYREEDLRWCGNALSGFGIIYNTAMLNEESLPAPSKWNDLAGDKYFGHITLADPSKSGSSAAIYGFIVDTEKQWRQGWSKLLAILGNTDRIVNSSTTAADAPSNGESAISACIDFYGYARQQVKPEVIRYVNPAGQTLYTPDPIAIHKDAQNPELAQGFVNFVLSCEGQGLWALPAGHENGPVSKALYRTPIRKDFYDKYAEAIPAWLKNPYEDSSEVKGAPELSSVRHGVLIELVRAAAVENYDLLKQVRVKMTESGAGQNFSEKFYELPADIDSVEDIRKMSKVFSDPAEKQKIAEQWTEFFKNKYTALLKM